MSERADRETNRPLPNFCICGNFMPQRHPSGNIMVYPARKALYANRKQRSRQLVCGKAMVYPRQSYGPKYSVSEVHSRIEKPLADASGSEAATVESVKN
jgi:hypothetical protein